VIVGEDEHGELKEKSIKSGLNVNPVIVGEDEHGELKAPKIRICDIDKPALRGRFRCLISRCRINLLLLCKIVDIHQI